MVYVVLFSNTCPISGTSYSSKVPHHIFSTALKSFRACACLCGVAYDDPLLLAGWWAPCVGLFIFSLNPHGLMILPGTQHVLSVSVDSKHTRGLANTTHPLPSDTGKGFQIRLHQTEERPGSPYGGVQPRVFSLLHIPWWSLLFPTRLLRARLTRQKLINSWNARVALKSEVGNTQVGPYTCVGSGLLTDLSVDSIQ